MPGLPTPLAPDTPLTLVTLGTTALRVSASPDERAAFGASEASPAGVAPDDSVIFDLGKPLALVTYLACAPDRSAPREHLIDLLWGGVEPDAGKHALRQTLWYIRKRLGDRQLIVGGDVLSIVGPLDSDRDALLAAAERGDSEAVVRTFAGDFFPGFAAPGGAEFERWADNERQRLRSHFWRATETIARRWMSGLKLRDAQMLARRARDLDPLREAGWRLLFETLVAAGDTVGSALEADAFDRLQAAEGISPEPATRAMLRAARQAPPGDEPLRTDDRPSLTAELVGREQEFAQLLACWEAARTGRSAHVHVLAPAGLGKTRLLTDVDARLRATRARTLFVRASLGGRDIPFGLAGDLAEGLARLPGASGISTGSARALVALNPALSASYPAALPDAGGDQSDVLRRRTVAVRELIAAVAEEHPIAVFVDDMQWADTRSRQLIAGVVGALDRVRVLLVTASRPGVEAFPSADHSRTIRLEPLTTADVGALVASVAALPSEPWSEHLAPELCDATGGSPLLVLETLQLLVEGNMLAHDGHAWSSRDPARLFAALGAGGAVRQRVERLDRVERWVLTLLAVAGVPLSRETLTAAAGRPADDMVTALGSLERRGFAARHGDAWVPSHDEIAAMALELATKDARRAASRATGRALLDHAGRDARALRHAGGLLVQADELERVSAAFTRFAHLARDAGDHRSNRVLAYDFLGERST
ncbi:MAG TPA: AAA family ATPase, partial [Gemmatimonadaceae bacterium]|nr:AAA family ATPase [Gemmatimonadaceae bacterium]